MGKILNLAASLITLTALLVNCGKGSNSTPRPSQSTQIPQSTTVVLTQIPPSSTSQPQTGGGDVASTYLHANGQIVVQHSQCFYYVIPQGATVFGLTEAFEDNYIVSRNLLQDPSRIRAGDGLTICPLGTVIEYVVVSNDTLYSISRRFDVALDDLRRANGLYPTGHLIYPGQKLYIPQ